MNRLIFVFVVAILLGGAIYISQTTNEQAEPIKVGVLHSLSGTMQVSEQNVVDATLLAIEEINAAGGIDGRLIEPIVIDGESDWDVFAEQAEYLINQEQVKTIFGCWTSACRKTVRPIFEANNHLLIYPVQYEGLEQSPNIIYTGAAPNQQIVPAVAWGLDNLGNQVFLVGSDYVFPRTANELIKNQIAALNGEVLGEEYVLLGDTDFEAIVDLIIETQPDVILNTLNGDSNQAFFNTLRAAGVTSEDIPTISFSIAEPELSSWFMDDLVGDYAVWNYFQSINSATNATFINAFQDRYGTERVLSDPMESAYIGVYLWAQAVEKVGADASPTLIRDAMLGQSFNAPQGVVYIDPQTQHTWKTIRIGQIQETGQFEIVWSSENPARPQPYPFYRSRSEWDDYLLDLYQGWDLQWANPG